MGFSQNHCFVAIESYRKQQLQQGTFTPLTSRRKTLWHLGMCQFQGRIYFPKERSPILPMVQPIPSASGEVDFLCAAPLGDIINGLLVHAHVGHTARTFEKTGQAD